MSDTVYVAPQPGYAKDNADVTVDATSGGVVILPANDNRRSALIINTGAAPMRVTTDGSSPTDVHGKLVPAGASLNLSSPFCPAAAVKAIRVGGTSTTANGSEVV